jgi:hypothetical protein
MIPTVRTWGNIQIPWTASWSSESTFTVEPCPWAGGKMALCQNESPGVGKPQFATPHSNRQRQAMAQQLCDICARPFLGRTRVSLSQESPRQVPGLGFVPLAVEPLVHKGCGVVALRQCPELQRQAAKGILRIRQVSACWLVEQRLNEAATMEFAGVKHSGAVGHLKLAITRFVDRDAAWLAAT